MFQFTHLLRGATAAGHMEHACRRSFNSRTSCEVRPTCQHDWKIQISVSIHAPLARCDHIYTRPYTHIVSFNSRTSCEVRLALNLKIASGASVSIHAPLARCDERRRRLARKRAGVSIHAPLARCDASGRGVPAWQRQFQFTHLLRGATFVR